MANYPGDAEFIRATETATRVQLRGLGQNFITLNTLAFPETETIRALRDGRDVNIERSTDEAMFDHLQKTAPKKEVVLVLIFKKDELSRRVVFKIDSYQIKFFGDSLVMGTTSEIAQWNNWVSE